MLTVEVGGESIVLLPEKAAFVPRTGTLLVADAHFGKAVSFRRLGVPVPRGTTSENLALLSALVARWRARRLVFLGDFLHSARAHAPSTLGAVARWRAGHAGAGPRAGARQPRRPCRRSARRTRLHGGRRAACRAAAWRCATTRHRDPRATCSRGTSIPAFRLGGRARDHLRLPCFHFGASVAVLPAFGSFTGMHAVRAVAGERVFAIADAAVVEVPT